MADHLHFGHIDPSSEPLRPCLFCGEMLQEDDAYKGRQPWRPAPGEYLGMFLGESSTMIGATMQGYVCARCAGASNEEMELRAREGAQCLRLLADKLDRLNISGGWPS